MVPSLRGGWSLNIQIRNQGYWSNMILTYLHLSTVISYILFIFVLSLTNSLNFIKRISFWGNFFWGNFFWGNFFLREFVLYYLVLIFNFFYIRKDNIPVFNFYFIEQNASWIALVRAENQSSLNDNTVRKWQKTLQYNKRAWMHKKWLEEKNQLPFNYDR
jgi:hypothetical protein